MSCGCVLTPEAREDVTWLYGDCYRVDHLLLQAILGRVQTSAGREHFNHSSLSSPDIRLLTKLAKNQTTSAESRLANKELNTDVNLRH